MAEVTQLKRYDAPRFNWGKWFLIGTGMLVSAFILVVPMVYIFVQAFSKGIIPALQNLADPDMLHAIWLTVMIALITVPVNLVFGVLLAWLVTRFNFPGRQLLLTLMAILTLFLKSVVQWRLENQEKRLQQEGNHEH